MTEHKKLKYIIDKIEYRIHYDFFYEDKQFKECYNEYDSCYMEREIDVREIIYTQEFINKYINYMSDYEWVDYIKEDLMSNLDNPVEFLFNLIKE